MLGDEIFAHRYPQFKENILILIARQEKHYFFLLCDLKQQICKTKERIGNHSCLLLLHLLACTKA